MIAEIAALAGDPARANILSALLDGRAMTASELAFAAHVTPQTASAHLAKLTEAGLINATPSGRHRYFRLASPLVGQMLESVMAVAGPAPQKTATWRGGEALRTARTCYDHLAGRLGVEVMAGLLRMDVLTGGDGRYDPARDLHDTLSNHGHDISYDLTDTGRGFLCELGVQLPSGRRQLARYCVDWSEQRHHLSGALGRAILDRFLDAQWVRRVPRGRALTVTERGRTALADGFGIEWAS